MDDKVLESYAGKTVARIVPRGGYGAFYRVEFTDGTWIKFHGGAVGYENANAWYEASPIASASTGERSEETRRRAIARYQALTGVVGMASDVWVLSHEFEWVRNGDTQSLEDYLNDKLDAIARGDVPNPGRAPQDADIAILPAAVRVEDGDILVFRLQRYAPHEVIAGLTASIEKWMQRYHEKTGKTIAFLVLPCEVELVHDQRAKDVVIPPVNPSLVHDLREKS